VLYYSIMGMCSVLAVCQYSLLDGYDIVLNALSKVQTE